MDGSKILVIGGGTMGRGIAGACALAGWTTQIFEAQDSIRATVGAAIRASWQRAVEKGKLNAEAAAQAAGRLSVTPQLQVPDDCDFALEAVPEDMTLKQRIFQELDRLSPSNTILASNTSSLSIAAIAGVTTKPGRVIGIHFFNPVAVMPLVEIVSSRETAAETRSRAEALVRKLGKTPIHVADTPGFATSRLGVALGLEAMRMVEEGVASPQDIDTAMELGYGHRMGPLKTSDLVGLDVRLSIAETLAAGIDRSRFEPPAILRRLVARGDIGKKSGLGFFRWEADEAIAAPVLERVKP